MSKSVLGLFQKKIVIEDINGKFQEGRVKVVGIPGGYTNIEEKTYISRGVNAKKWKIPGGYGKFDWKSRGANFKKIDILNRGRRVQFFSGNIFFFCR